MGRADATRPPESRRQQRRIQYQDLSRSQLLDAAEEVFGRQGFNDATLKEIAELAEFSVGSVYSFFTSKEDLYLSVFTRRGGAFLPALAAVVAGAGTALERLHRLVDFEVEFFRDHPHFGRLPANRRSPVPTLPFSGARHGSARPSGGGALSGGLLQRRRAPRRRPAGRLCCRRPRRSHAGLPLQPAGPVGRCRHPAAGTAGHRLPAAGSASTIPGPRCGWRAFPHDGLRQRRRGSTSSAKSRIERTTCSWAMPPTPIHATTFSTPASPSAPSFSTQPSGSSNTRIDSFHSS
jgi:AcrR family transcriptional regulator